MNEPNNSEFATPCGVLTLHKTAGMTSHDAVNRIRRLYGTKQVGHTGTLDPMATGLLIVLIGRAAKFAEFLTSDGKAYTAIMRLGVTSDTGDVTGNLTYTEKPLPSEDEVKRVCREKFVGEITQIPPMYSALKVGGQKLVDLARRGITVEREPRPVTIHSLDVRRLSDTDYELTVACSKGTYIRTLCEDIGDALGCGGTMAALRRDVSGRFALEGAPTLEELETMTLEERNARLVGVEELFGDLRGIVLPPFFAHLAASGCEIYMKKIANAAVIPSGEMVKSAENPLFIGNSAFEVGELVRFYDADGFFALAKCGEFSEGLAFKAVKQYRVNSEFGIRNSEL